jgi:hypothetical protein
MAESLAVARGFGITRAPFETYSKYARSPPLRSGGGLGRGRDKHHGTVQNTAAILSKTPTRPRWRARASTLRRARELRREPPPAERALWRCLRARQIGNFAFRQQHPIGPFISTSTVPGRSSSWRWTGTRTERKKNTTTVGRAGSSRSVGFGWFGSPTTTFSARMQCSNRFAPTCLSRPHPSPPPLTRGRGPESALRFWVAGVSPR